MSMNAIWDRPTNFKFTLVNAGNQQDEQTVELLRDGAVIDSVTASLQPGESTQVTLGIDSADAADVGTNVTYSVNVKGDFVEQTVQYIVESVDPGTEVTVDVSNVNRVCRFELGGGSGSDSDDGAGGDNGGRIDAEFDVSPYDELQIHCGNGSGPTQRQGFYPDGGTGGDQSFGYGYGGGGGGSSQVQDGGGTVLLDASGGGGGGGNGSNDKGGGGDGGDGGGLYGGSGGAGGGYGSPSGGNPGGEGLEISGTVNSTGNNYGDGFADIFKPL